MKKSIPCLLLLNDVHISKDNIPEFTVNWLEAISVCETMNIRNIALGGDLFQSRAAQTLDVLMAVHDALILAEKKGIMVTLANGNHDKINQEATRGYCHIFDQHPNVTVVDDYLTLYNDQWDFVLHIIAYYPEDGGFVNVLDKVIQDDIVDDKLNLLYIHEGINGALSQPCEKELPADIFEDFYQVFVGHYHNRGYVKDTKILYIGSSRQHNFGEDEEKGYTVIHNDSAHEFIKNEANMRYRVLEVPVEEVNTILYDKLDEMKADGRYRVKVKVHTSSALASSIDKAKLLNAGASKVEVISEDLEVINTNSSDLFEKFDNNKINESYGVFCSEKKIEDVEMGLSYLSKIESHVAVK